MWHEKTTTLVIQVEHSLPIIILKTYVFCFQVQLISARENSLSSGKFTAHWVVLHPLWRRVRNHNGFLNVVDLLLRCPQTDITFGKLTRRHRS